MFVSRTLASNNSFSNDFVVLKNEIQQEEDNKYKNIEYKKNNPFIFGQNSSNKKFHKWYNFVKFTLVLSTFIFCLISLWYATQWKSNTLTNLGIDLVGKFKFNPISGNDGSSNVFVPYWDNSWDAQIAEASKLSLGEWSSSIISSSTINILIALCFVGLVLIITSLVFKNGTTFSVISLSLMTIFLVVVIALFLVGINSQSPVINLYKDDNAVRIYSEIQRLCENYEQNQEQITKLGTELENSITNTIESILKLVKAS